MKKTTPRPFPRFLLYLSELNSGQQFLIVVVFLALFSFLAWKYFSPHFRADLQTDSTASYEGLDPASIGYWRERTERDIASARELTSPARPLNDLLNRNISSTIRTAGRLSDPAEKINALAMIVHAQISQNVGTNLDEALYVLGNTPETRSVRMSLAAPLAFYYIQIDNRDKAASIVGNYLTLLKETSFNPEIEEQRNTFIKILDACVLLNLDRELDTALANLSNMANSLRIESRRDSLLTFIAEQQIRFQKYSDAFTTLSVLTQPDILAKCYRKLIESRAQIFPVASGEGLPDSRSFAGPTKIRHPELVAQTVERVFINIARLKDSKTQQEVLNQLFESEMMVNMNLHDLIRSVLVDTRSLDASLKTQSLSIVDNPRSESIRKALGMPPLVSESEIASEQQETDLQLLDRASQVLGVQPLSRNRTYLEDIRILMNTATELLNWGKRKDAIPLLNRAAARIRGLDVEKNQGVSRPALAALLVGAGEIESAQSLLNEELEIVKFSQRTPQTDSELARIAEIQLRARLLDDSLRTLREMLPGSTKTDLLKSLALEQIKVGRFEEAQKTVAEMPADPVKTNLRRTLEEAIPRLRKKLNENIYAFSPLDEILKSDFPDKQHRLFDLVVLLVREGLFIDARETARQISDLPTRNRALDLIVQETVALIRPYFSKIPFHQQIRKNMISFGFQTAKEITAPQERLVAMERVYSLTDASLYPNENSAEWKEMVSLWDSLSDATETEVKVDSAIRLYQDELKRRADDVLTLVSGNWCLLPASGESVSENLKHMLLKAGELTHKLKSSEDRATRFAQITALLEQSRDKENGELFFEAAVDACGSGISPGVSAVVFLSLAQTSYLTDKPDEATVLFNQAVDQAENIISKDNSKRIDRLLEKRVKDRTLSDICRGEAELGLIREAVGTSGKINEKFFVDRLSKTIGYIQLGKNEFENAEATFKTIKDTKWKNSCVNDALFRRRWGVFEM